MKDDAHNSTIVAILLGASLALALFVTGCADEPTDLADRNLEGGPPSPVSADSLLSPSRLAGQGGSVNPEGGTSGISPDSGGTAPSPGSTGSGSTPPAGGPGCPVGDLECACNTLEALVDRCGLQQFLEGDFGAECRQTNPDEILGSCREQGMDVDVCWDLLVNNLIVCLDQTCDPQRCFDFDGPEPEPEPVPPGGGIPDGPIQDGGQ